MKKYFRILGLLAMGSFPFVHANIITISEAGIQKAYQDYEREVELAPKVKAGIALGTLVTGIVGYYGYLYYTQPTYCCISVDDYAVRIQYLENRVKNLEACSRSSLQETWMQWCNRNMYSLGSALLTTGLVNAASEHCVMPLLNYIRDFKRKIPQSGSLRWYVQARTNYSVTITDSKRFAIAEDRENLNGVIPLLLHDVEKILGYVRYTAHTNKTLSGHLQKRLFAMEQNIIHWFKEIGESLADNERSMFVKVSQGLDNIASEIASVTHLIGFLV